MSDVFFITSLLTQLQLILFCYFKLSVNFTLLKLFEYAKLF